MDGGRPRPRLGPPREAPEAEDEDVVQDAHLRWERGGTAVSPEVWLAKPVAWLTKVVTNL